MGISPPPPEECQLFNMESAVTRLETLVSPGGGRAEKGWLGRGRERLDGH